MAETFECEVKSIVETKNKNSTTYAVKLKGKSTKDSQLKMDLTLKSPFDGDYYGMAISEIKIVELK